MYHQLLLWIMQDSIEWVSYRFYVKSLVINFYLFLPTHLSTILLRKHGLISKSTSKRYYQVAILFLRLFCLILVSIYCRSISSNALELALHYSSFMTKNQKATLNTLLSDVNTVTCISTHFTDFIQITCY